jgi:hypothetical protein
MLRVDTTFALGRWFTALFVAALCTTFLVASEGKALARADCLQADPAADVFVTETLTATTLDAIVTNVGPCNVPDAVITITFPAGTTIGGVSSSPTSWNCAAAGNVVTCPTAGGAPTIGVPGNHEFLISFVAPSSGDLTIKTDVTLGGGPVACTDSNSRTTCDPNPDNNVIWAAAVPSGGGSLTTCASTPCTQYAAISVDGGSGGAVQVQQQSGCPSAFPNCFGKLTSIKSGITSATWLNTFTIDLSLISKSWAQVNLIRGTDTNSDGVIDSWQIMPSCSKTLTINCVLSKTRFKSGGVTYGQFLVKTDADDQWGFE